MQCELNSYTISDELQQQAKEYVYPTAASPEKIVVALSGGVDSAFCALYLHKMGHDVTGVTLRLAPDRPSDLKAQPGRCCSVDDMHDARQLCEHLGIGFYAIDARERFHDEVVLPFAKAYQNGATPIPCIACNHEVKFGDLLKTAKQLGAKLATGHYAKIKEYKGQKAIARPDDEARDQSYYLYGTPAEACVDLLFPLAEFKKPFIRALLAEEGIPVFDKPDSQEICFVPDGNHKKVIEKLGIFPPKGNLVHIDGKILKQHEGIHGYTIGQRRGMGIGTGERLYVIDIDAQNGDVTVGPKESLLSQNLEAAPVRYAVKKELWPERVLIKLRARQKPVWAHIKILDEVIQIALEDPIEAVAPGQAAVIYDDDILLGGGVIIARKDGARPRALPILKAAGLNTSL